MAWIFRRPVPVFPRIALGFGGLLILLNSCLQIELRERVRYRWCIAKSGLVLREGPGLEYARIDTIPFGARVRMVGIASESTTLSGRVGRWNKLVYQGQLGYSYDAFLAKAPPGPSRLSVSYPPASTGDAPVSPDSPELEKIEQVRQYPESADPQQPKGDEDPAETALPSPVDYAYSTQDIRGLIKLSGDEFNEIAGSLHADFRARKFAFQKCAGERSREESTEDYLRRSEDAKRRFLNQLRKEEHAAATRVYSIGEAKLELGPYEPAPGRFTWLGTSVPIDVPGEAITLPDNRAGRHRFVNGRKYNVDMSPSQAEAIMDAREEIRVRIDFSYTVSLQNLFNWRLKTYFLPRYLMLYHVKTGRVYYTCSILPLIERDSDPAAPLRITAHFLEEAVY